MKNIVAGILLFAMMPLANPRERSSPIQFKETGKRSASPNLIVVTIDGFRWQELFNGADANLISDVHFTPDTSTMKLLYWAETKEERRQKLMPFFWSVLAGKGQLYGNRLYRNKVNTSNMYNFSYPGYNEIVTGNSDIRVASNKKEWNRNRNVLEFLEAKDDLNGKVVAFTSWDVFPYIFNEERSGILVNSGYENMGEENRSPTQGLIDSVQSTAVYNKGGTRHDQLTFLTAKEYLQRHSPRLCFIGFGETDEFAHGRRYDLYLAQANKIDRMLAELWHWIQTTPGYRDNTNILITTDHGRGTQDKWTSHSSFIRGSSQTWLALMGPSVEPLGEVKEEQQLYQREIAGMIAELMGEKFIVTR